MRDKIVVDTSTLIVLDKIGELSLLESVYGAVTCTSAVIEEFGGRLPGWVKEKNATDINYENLLRHNLGKGEASSIAVCLENRGSLLILDDLKARKKAISLDLRVTGALGVISKAKRVGVIPNVKPVVGKLIETNFRISETIVLEILRINNE